MNPANWLKIKTIFHEALDIDLNERERFLSNACKNDSSLRREVEGLLSAHDEAGDFIVSPALIEAGVIEPETSIAGKRIGHYEILEEIGRGGMGAVYLAVRADDEYKKQVAIKLIKRGMDSDAILKRFRNERQILANLEHENIARLIDGGTTEDGLPYFVMEYVKGEPITKYCDNKNLNTNERLKLFRKVCSAIQYSHQNLVVHRDIKPSNIIVTADGTPKLLDFGIAKLIQPDLYDDATEATASMMQMMTPEYASPEQLRGLPITTTTDVYSLGVVLYELLSGQRPYKTKSRSPQEIAQAILTEEPLRPSDAVSGQRSVVSAEMPEAETLKRQNAETVIGDFSNLTRKEYKQRTTDNGQRTKRNPQSAIRNPQSLKGDIDNIVLKAIRKEPERRYASVQEFSEDIRRHLKGLPVTARADTFGYRAGKFISRHKAGVVVVVLFVITLLSASIITSWQARVARNERAKAEQRFKDVRQLTNSILFDFDDAIHELPGANPARELLVKKAIEYLDKLLREGGDDPSLKFELAIAYFRIGDIQGAPQKSNMGDTTGALESYRKAAEITEALVKADSNNQEYKRHLARIYRYTADINMVTGEAEAAAQNLSKAMSILEELTRLDPANNATKNDLAYCYKGIGDITASKGDLNGAVENYRKTLELSKAVLANDSQNKYALGLLIAGYDAVGTCSGNPNYTNLGDPDTALENLRKILEVSEGELKKDKNNSYFQNVQAYTLKSVGEVLTAKGDWQGALEYFKESLKGWQILVDADPKDVFSNSRMAYTHSNMGEALAETGNITEALKHHQKAMEMLSELSEATQMNAEILAYLARSQRMNGDTLLKAGNINSAMEFFNKALLSDESMANEDANNLDIRLALANDYAKIAKVNAMLAMTATPTNKKIELWLSARKRFEQSRDVYLYMQASNLRTKPINDALGKIQQEIERCEDALKKLQTK